MRGWPSCVGTLGAAPFIARACIDAICQMANTIMDATRKSDGKVVTIKSIDQTVHPFEEEIGKYLSSPDLASDPTNHCVPIYEVLRVPDVEDRILLVMPILRPFNDPPFEAVGEAMDFFQQIFEVNMTNCSKSFHANVRLGA